jgi:hypothetical protein
MPTTVTAFSNMDPTPRVKLDIDSANLPVGTVTVQVRRSSKWGTVDVRQSRRLAAGGLVVTDYEPPVGVPVTYSMEGYDNSGVSVGVSSFTATVQVDIRVGDVVISDPFAPASAVLLRAELDFAPSMSKERPVATYRAGGDTIALAGLRSMLQDVALRVFTRSDTERDALEGILQEASLVQVRTMPDMRLPGELFMVIPGRQVMRPLDARDGGDWDEWVMAGEQVTRPALDILVALINYDRFKAYLDTLHPPTPGTYNDAMATWSTYLDAMRNPPPEV